MASDEPTDGQLIERARKGDSRAFEVLCGRYEDVLRARARRWIVGALNRKISLVDILQEALFAAHERLEDFEDRGDGAFGAWLGQIAEYKTREAVRRHYGTAKRDAGREITRGGRPDTAHAPGSEPTPSHLASDQENLARVREAMQALSPDHRLVLQLVQLDEIPLKEVAVLMDRSYEATRKVYGRAVTALSREMKRRGESS